MIIIGPGWYDYHSFTIIAQPYTYATVIAHMFNNFNQINTLFKTVYFKRGLTAETIQ